MPLADVFVRSGKVRDLYQVGEDLLLLVASDRLSAFDVVLPTAIPDKGRILTGLSRFWFAQTTDIVANHLVSTDPADLPDEVSGGDASTLADLRGRMMLGRRADVLPVECVVRGYLSGSGWKEYQATRAVSGIGFPEGLRESDRLPSPVFTPAWKAPAGQHDENIPFHRVGELIGEELADRVRTISLALYARGSALCERVGIILADTKFEFGVTPEGELLLIDEVMTPDSSRFWDAAAYEPGRAQASYDKQFVRDWLLRPAVGQDRAGAGAPGRRGGRHPSPLRRGLRTHHRGELRPLSLGGRHRPMSELARAYRFAVNVTPKPGILDPQGKAVERSLPHLGIAGVTGVRVGRRVELTVAAADEAAARAVVDRLAGELLSNPLMEQFEVEPLGETEAPAVAGRGRMSVRVGVVLFPGSNRDIDAVNALRVAGAEPEILWHESADLAGVAGILIPGGFAYGDYLRAGVIARFSPVMRAVADFAARGGPVLGICNGFQVLAEARLVPGALLRNRGLRFVCRQVTLLPEHLDTPFTREIGERRPLRMPVAHGEGCYYADEATLDELERDGGVLWRYANADGSVAGPDDPGNPNGSLRGIAGVRNAAGNVAGLMPHPETAWRRSWAATTASGSSARWW